MRRTDPATRTTLFCTVGGSHQPILRAIESYRPDRVVFICSDDDPASRSKGSYTQATGRGAVCTSAAGPRSAPDLPNIPAQAGLHEGAFDVRRVPADDPVVAVESILGWLGQEVETGARVVADYTGGTKSMAAALFHAGVLVPGVELSLVSGPRANLIQVGDGAERVHTLAGAARLETGWRVAEAARAWGRFAYAEAAEVLRATPVPTADSEAARLLSQGFAAWDAGDHASARGMLQTMGRRSLAPYLIASSQLARNPDEDDQRGTACRIWDLLLAAERHTQTHRHDTAVLLRYRAFEWIAQWSLRWHHQIDCADAPLSGELAEGPLKGLAHPGHDRRGKIGAYNAWQAVSRLGGPLAEVARTCAPGLLSFTKKRNASRLAHGAASVSREEDEAAADWFESHVQPAFLEVAFGRREPCPQLPRALMPLLNDA